MKQSLVAELLAEFLGTMVLILFGNGVVAMVKLFGDSVPGEIVNGGFTNITLAWGLGVTMGIFVAAPIAGALAARLGPRVPITLGALCSGTALLLLMRLGPATPYAAIWWNLGLGGIGFGLMLSPLAAAVLGALPPTRSGLASSMINMSRQVGGVFGVALLGALVQGQYASNIANGLTQHGIPSQISQSIANAIAGAGIQAGKVLGRQHLPLPTTTLHALANQSFTDALHGAFLVAGLALLVSAAASAFLLGRRQPSVAANPEATAESQPPEAMPAVAEIA